RDLPRLGCGLSRTEPRVPCADRADARLPRTPHRGAGRAGRAAAGRRSMSTRVAALLPPVEAVDALPPELLPGLVAGLAALQARAAARLAVPAPAPTNGRPEPDVLL